MEKFFLQKGKNIFVKLFYVNSKTFEIEISFRDSQVLYQLFYRLFSSLLPLHILFWLSSSWHKSKNYFLREGPAKVHKINFICATCQPEK